MNKKDNIINVPFTRDMLVKQCLEKAMDSLPEFEDVLILARDREGDLLMFHSFSDRASVVDCVEECKFALYSGDFFDA